VPALTVIPPGRSCRRDAPPAGRPRRRGVEPSVGQRFKPRNGAPVTGWWPAGRRRGRVVACDGADTTRGLGGLPARLAGRPPGSGIVGTLGLPAEFAAAGHRARRPGAAARTCWTWPTAIWTQGLRKPARGNRDPGSSGMEVPSTILVCSLCRGIVWRPGRERPQAAGDHATAVHPRGAGNCRGPRGRIRVMLGSPAS
jgi:hypothetical protein